MEEIKRMYERGMGADEIAEKVGGCCGCTIRNRLEKEGVPIHHRNNYRRQIIKIPGKDALIYFAGILDGEGSITFFNSPNSKDEQVVGIGIANCSIELMDWLVANFGHKYEEKRMNLPMIDGRVIYNRQRQWQWRVRRMRDCLALLEAVEPYLIIKREEAITAINYLKYRFATLGWDEPYWTKKSKKEE
jgi:hypothetical protein